MLLATVVSPVRAGLLAPGVDTRPRRAALPGVAGVQPLVLDRPALGRLRARDHAVVRDVPLGHARRADLVLDRFDPFTAGARAEVVEASGVRTLSLPDHVYFRGTVAGEPDSHVLLIAARTRVHGYVVSHGEVFPFGPDRSGRHVSYALRDADPAAYPPPRDFCANDLEPAAVQVLDAPDVAAAPAVQETSGTVKQADVAIETDQELRGKFASDTAALDYLASLAAAATAIYERDVAVRLRFSYIRLWNTSDPWTSSTTTGALTEVRGYWNNLANDMANIAGPRTVVHFISGKAVQGGVAYVNVLCNQSYGYGASQVYGSFDLSQPSQVWDVIVFTHELGHNFGSPHSHCYSPPLDECYNAETGCYSGPVVASRGTIMSYCHLLGGVANIDLVLGTVVSQRIGQSVAGASCLATVAASTTTTSTPTTSMTSSTVSAVTTTSSTTGSSVTTTTATGADDSDSDGDGIPDARDACPDTQSREMVDGAGCSLCPCAGPSGVTWTSHAAYVRCVRGTLPFVGRGQRKATLALARRSSCGRPGTTRCCVARSAGAPADKCHILPVRACEERAASGRGVDLGPGSCGPLLCIP